MDISVMEGSMGGTLSLKGRFDFSCHRQFREIVDRLIAAGKASLTVDLSGVDFIDSSGLGMLLVARESCGKAGADVKLTHPQGYVARVLSLCHFEELFPIEQ